MQIVIQILGADLADRCANAQIAAEQTNIADERFNGIDREALILHVPLKHTQSGLQRCLASQRCASMGAHSAVRRFAD